MPDRRDVTASVLARWPLPQADRTAGKLDRGTVAVIGGSAETPGAVLLAGLAALRAGAGRLAIATASRVAPALGVAIPEARVVGLPETPAGALDADGVDAASAMAESARALLIGPGMFDQQATGALVGRVLEGLTDSAVALDAMALARLEVDADALRPFAGRSVVTPNVKELGLMLDLGDDDLGDNDAVIVAAEEAARRFGAVVSVGGAVTVVAVPEGPTWLDGTGGAGLGVSGSGDGQAGLVAGLLARGAEAAQAAVWAAHVYGRAGERLAARVGRLGYLAREVTDEIPLVIRELEA
jgi:ADP-dependent NAD(P)H-hydrate dehydratase